MPDVNQIEVKEPIEIKAMQEEEFLEQEIEVGDKVYFKTQKSPMKVKARNGRYVICTEPFYRQKTVLYSILDLEAKWKAPNNLVFNKYNYDDQESIEESLRDLEAGKYELSQKRGIVLDIDWDKTRKTKAKNNKKK